MIIEKPKNVKPKKIYPKNEIECLKIINQIKEITNNNIKNKMDQITNLLNLEYRGPIAKSIKKTKHYGKYSDRNQIVNYHHIIILNYGNKLLDINKQIIHDVIQLKPRKQKGRNSFYIEVTIKDGFEVDHIKEVEEIFNPTIEYMNNYRILTIEEHKNRHEN